MSWCRLAACKSLILLTGCAWQGPALAQAPVPGEIQPAVQLQPPREEPALQPVSVSTKPPAPPGQVAVRISAYVGETPILDDEVRTAIHPFLPMIQALPEPERSVRLKEATSKELEKLIERELIIADAMARLKKNMRAVDKLKEAAGKEFDKQLQTWRENLNRQGLKIETEDDLKPILSSCAANPSAISLPGNT
jgi:hypothetical protein